MIALTILMNELCLIVSRSFLIVSRSCLFVSGSCLIVSRSCLIVSRSFQFPILQGKSFPPKSPQKRGKTDEGKSAKKLKKTHPASSRSPAGTPGISLVFILEYYLCRIEFVNEQDRSSDQFSLLQFLLFFEFLILVFFSCNHHRND